MHNQARLDIYNSKVYVVQNDTRRRDRRGGLCRGWKLARAGKRTPRRYEACGFGLGLCSAPAF